MPDPQTARIDLRFTGERNFPVATGTIPTALMHDFDALLTEARVHYPTYTHEQMVRHIWMKGLDSFRHSLQVVGAPPDPNRTPAPKHRTS